MKNSKSGLRRGTAAGLSAPNGRWGKRDQKTGRFVGLRAAGDTEGRGGLFTFAPREAAPEIYVGPIADGADEEYVKVVSGKVSMRKPSFAR